MNYQRFKPFVLAIATMGLTVIGPCSLLHAQDRPRDDQNMRQADQDRPADHRDDHARPDNQRSDRGDDRVVKWRQDHPHAAAHCHDGFFTRTSDHNRACSKHGGVDVWLNE